MPRKDKVIHISNLPSTFRGNVTRNGRFIQNGIPPLGEAYDKVAKSTGLIRLGNEFLYNGVNNLVSKDNREKLMNNTAGRLINYVKDFNKESFPSDDELGPTFPFNIIQTTRSNGKKLPQKQYAVGGKIPNVVAGGIAQPLGNNFFYMNGRKHSQGGIDIGPSDKTGIEVEDGEVVETNGNELKVYSAQPIINGVSPAKLVMGGANPNKVFKAQEDFKDRNRINDDGTKYKEGGKIYQAPNEYKRQIAESGSIIIGGYPTIAGNRNYKFIKGLTKASRIGRTATNFINLGRQKIYDLANKIDNTWINQGIKEVYRTTIGKHGSNIPRTVDYITNKLNINEDNKKAMGGLNRNKDYGSKKKPYPSVAKKDFAGGHRSYPIPTKADAIDALRLAGLHGRNDVKAKVYNKYPELRKKGNTGLVISINGNVKNGLLHSPSSTGGRHDKLRDGGRRTNPDSLKADRLWSDRQINKIRYLTDLRNSTRNIIVPTGYKVTDIHRTNEPGRYSLAVNIPNQDSINVNIPLRNLPASNIPKGEEYIEKLIEADRKLNLKSDRSNYTRGYDGRVYFKSWINGKSGEINYGTNDFYNQTRSGKNALENARPQYYAERELPLFDDGPAITSGLIRAGWSHGNNKNITVDNTNIPNLPATKSKGNTPRRGRNKSSQSTQSISTKTPPTAVYNRNLPKVEASIPTTLPVSTNTPAQGTKYSDGKGQGRFKNLTTADWIGLGSNVAGSLASYFASKRAINKMRGPGQPTLISANKLKTKYNINPQLDRIREDKFEAYRDIDSNTASSRVSLARKQRVRNAAGQAVNELYGNKENIETNLINQDRRNQQSVRQFNAQQYNQYIDRKTAFDNGIREAKVTNINNLFSGINAGIQDMISRYENRKALNNTIGAMRASAPNVDDRIMRDAGVDYDEFIIRKRRKLGGKQSCR
ncbi:MAG: hypothetical protein [Bacteriophage sp.]|nr:MAG: hypothetical protein [Bacteriophage sp.]